MAANLAIFGRNRPLRQFKIHKDSNVIDIARPTAGSKTGMLLCIG